MFLDCWSFLCANVNERSRPIDPVNSMESAAQISLTLPQHLNVTIKKIKERNPVRQPFQIFNQTSAPYDDKFGRHQKMSFVISSK